VAALIPERLLFLNAPYFGPAAQPVPGMPGFPAFAPAAAVLPEYWRGFYDALTQIQAGGTAYAPSPGAAFGAGAPYPGMAGAFAYTPGQGPPVVATPAIPAFASAVSSSFGGDPDQGNAFTWGLSVTGTLTSNFTGAGVKVCILDTGIDLSHPDFQDRGLDSTHCVSFIPGEDVQDNHGHGTHVTGTACGPKTSVGGKRYGIASGAEIFIGKVMPNAGQTTANLFGPAGNGTPEGIVLQGIEWAVTQGCRVVSISLGAPAQGPVPAGSIYDTVARRALVHGTIIIAAAGNRSRRSQGILKPVDIPADSSAILGVGALTPGMQVADFSNRAFFPPAGAVDLAGPGVNVYSSASLTGQAIPGPFNLASGTSQATPHVSGLAALASEQNPTWTAAQVMDTLLKMAKSLPLDPRDVGNGLVQALG
jgi:subtilisin family serine protease